MSIYAVKFEVENFEHLYLELIKKQSKITLHKRWANLYGKSAYAHFLHKKVGHWIDGWVDGWMLEPGKGLLTAIKKWGLSDMPRDS